MHKTHTQSIALVALGCAFVCVCAFLSVPAPVPFTMQTFGIALLLLVLGGRRGFFAVALYLGLGCLGVPVFAGFVGGIGVFASFSGGFLLGFLAMAGVYACLSRTCPQMGQWLSLCLGLFACYAVGAAWCFGLSFWMGAPLSFSGLLSLCVLPYLVPDFIKTGLALLLAKRLRRHAFFRSL